MEQKNNIHSYKIIPELNLIYRFFKGSFNLSDIIGTKELLKKDKDYLPTLNYLNDVREAKIETTAEDVIKYINYVKSNKSVYDKRKSIFVTDTPNQVVFVTLLNLKKDENLIDLYVVSSLGMALRTLEIPETYKNYINDLIIENK